MKPLTSEQIRGNWATLLSAWNADDSLDLGRVAAEIDARALPVDTGATFEQALHGGEDYELLFSAPAKARIPKEIAGVAVSRIGRVLRRRSGRAPITLVSDGKEQGLEPQGWQHFS